MIAQPIIYKHKKPFTAVVVTAPPISRKKLLILQPLGAIKFYANSQGNYLHIETFLVDCIICRLYHSKYFTSKFHDSHSIYRCFWWLPSAQKFSSSCSCYDQPIFDKVFNVFIQSKLLMYLQVFFITISYCIILVFPLQPFFGLI